MPASVKAQGEDPAVATMPLAADYAVVVIEDYVDTMDGPALHDAALACIRTAFGTVMWSEEIRGLLKAEARQGE